MLSVTSHNSPAIGEWVYYSTISCSALLYTDVAHSSPELPDVPHSISTFLPNLICWGHISTADLNYFLLPREFRNSILWRVGIQFSYPTPILTILWGRCWQPTAHWLDLACHPWSFGPCGAWLGVQSLLFNLPHTGQGTSRVAYPGSCSPRVLMCGTETLWCWAGGSVLPYLACSKLGRSLISQAEFCTAISKSLATWKFGDDIIAKMSGPIAGMVADPCFGGSYET